MLRFDNDYMAGAHPRIISALQATNMERTTGYGSDPYTAMATRMLLDACDIDAGEVFFLMGGTQTNATVIDGLLGRHEGVLACETAHINVHEAGAIEASGHKVITLPQHAGKLSAADLQLYISEFYADGMSRHMVAPGMVYITHPTEVGTLYTLAELEELAAVCRQADIPLYLDGARLGYGLAADGTDVTLPDIARLTDIFYFGGTKIGALFGEAVVVKNPMRLRHFPTLVKQHGALLAKGRLLGLQFATLLADNLFMEICGRADRLAMRIRSALVSKGYVMIVDSPTNQQFVLLPNETIDRLADKVSFALWGPRGETHSTVRIVTDWSTTDDEVDRLIALF